MKSGFWCAVAFSLATSVGAAAQVDGAQEDGVQQGEQAETVCVQPGALPRDLATFDDRVAAKATPGEYDLAVAKLEIGHAVDATLSPIEEMDFVIDPERWPEPGTFAGMFSFDAPAAGTYKVSVSEGAWIDVVAGDDLVTSEIFGRGPACTSIRKVVEFPLQAGVHVLQISGAPTDNIAVMVSYKPAEDTPATE